METSFKMGEMIVKIKYIGVFPTKYLESMLAFSISYFEFCRGEFERIILISYINLSLEGRA